MSPNAGQLRGPTDQNSIRFGSPRQQEPAHPRPRRMPDALKSLAVEFDGPRSRLRGVSAARAVKFLTESVTPGIGVWIMRSMASQAQAPDISKSSQIRARLAKGMSTADIVT